MAEIIKAYKQHIRQFASSVKGNVILDICFYIK